MRCVCYYKKMGRQSKFAPGVKKSNYTSEGASVTPGFHRFYRKASAHDDEQSFQVVAGQTDLWITVRRVPGIDFAKEALACVADLRSQLQSWMLLEPAFGPALTPLSVPAHAPHIVRRMSAACARMGVGPMAAVAGGIASLVAEHLLRFSPDVIVENGGDIMLHSTRERVIALLPDPGRKAVLAVRIREGEFPVSLCSSSSTIGHSLSFGNGELAVVRARDAFFADAAATAFCNALREADDVQKVLDTAAELGVAGSAAEKEQRGAQEQHPEPGDGAWGVEGVFVQCKGVVGVWGNMELVPL